MIDLWDKIKMKKSMLNHFSFRKKKIFSSLLTFFPYNFWSSLGLLKGSILTALTWNFQASYRSEKTWSTAALFFSHREQLLQMESNFSLPGAAYSSFILPRAQSALKVQWLFILSVGQVDRPWTKAYFLFFTLLLIIL